MSGKGKASVRIEIFCDTIKIFFFVSGKVPENRRDTEHTFQDIQIRIVLGKREFPLRNDLESRLLQPATILFDALMTG